MVFVLTITEIFSGNLYIESEFDKILNQEPAYVDDFP